MLARTVLRRASGGMRSHRMGSFTHITLPYRRDQEEQRRDLHTSSSLREFRSSPVVESTTPLVVGLGVAGIAYTGKLAIEAFDKYQERQKASADGEGEDGKEKTEASSTSWFSFGTRFYEGGFEDEMTRREAALILGIRESSPRERVREAHRRLAIINHPDQGGSTFVAAKINEAKDKLLGSA